MPKDCIIDLEAFKNIYRTKIANDTNVNVDSVMILNIVPDSNNDTVITFTIETDTPNEQGFIANLVTTTFPVNLATQTLTKDVLAEKAVDMFNNTNIFSVFDTQTYTRQKKNDESMKYDLIVDIPWIAAPDASMNNWRHLFSFVNETDLSTHNSFSDFFIYNNKYYTSKDQWYGDNILATSVPGSDGEFETIAFDYLKHLGNDVFCTDLGYILFDNKDEIFDHIAQSPVDQDIIHKLISSNNTGKTGKTSSEVFPFEIFTQMLYNSQVGRDRLSRLLDERVNLKDPMYLLDVGDKLVFNLRINPSKDYDPNNPPTVLDQELTPKVYRIVLTLM